MAVTMFLRESQTYDDFVQSIDRVASSNPDITFIVKNHPLSKHDVDLKAPNVVIAERSDNIHALIDVSTFTVCYNSGVGLISLIHGRPTYTIGNAYYNRGGAGRFCNSLEEAVHRHRDDPHAPDADCVVRLVTWLRRHRCSVFTATDDVREHADRRSHGYREVTVTRLVLDGKAHELGRAAAAHPFSERSYGMGLLGLSLKGEDVVAARSRGLRTQGLQSSVGSMRRPHFSCDPAALHAEEVREKAGRQSGPILPRREDAGHAGNRMASSSPSRAAARLSIEGELTACLASVGRVTGRRG